MPGVQAVKYLHNAMPIEAVNIPGGVHLLYKPMPHNSLKFDITSDCGTSAVSENWVRWRAYLHRLYSDASAPTYPRELGIKNCQDDLSK